MNSVRRPSGPGPQRGVVLPSPVVMLSIVAVVMAAVAFVATRGDGDDEIAVPMDSITASTSVTPSVSASPSATASAKPTPKPVNRRKVDVVIFNNTAIKGLAGTVSDQAEKIGWDVVGADNWHGSIPATTVYYPAKLKAAAKQLALDLGIKRTAAAQSPMSNSRVTVILTGPLD